MSVKDRVQKNTSLLRSVLRLGSGWASTLWLASRLGLRLRVEVMVRGKVRVKVRVRAKAEGRAYG